MIPILIKTKDKNNMKKISWSICIMRIWGELLIEQIDNPEKLSQSDNKKILFPSDRNHSKENIDENIIYNLNDKMPLNY